jgi:predicted O-methyltransferase YrrM
MITDERFTAYINSLENGNPPYLDELEAFAKNTQVPIIRKEMQSLMRTLLVMNKPKRILEVGTAIGFSALFMKEFMPEDGQIITIEKYEKRIPLAKENFSRFDKKGQITLLEGDAAEILKTLQEPFDFIFMDAAKGQYIHFLPDVLRLLVSGGVLLSDNVLQDGDIIESKYAVTRRDRTIHKRMREYLYTLKNHEELETAILTLGDGVALSVKKEKRSKL